MNVMNVVNVKSVKGDKSDDNERVAHPPLRTSRPVVCPGRPAGPCRSCTRRTAAGASTWCAPA